MKKEIKFNEEMIEIWQRNELKLQDNGWFRWINLNFVHVWWIVFCQGRNCCLCVVVYYKGCRVFWRVCLHWLINISVNYCIYRLVILILNLIRISSCWSDWYIHDFHDVIMQNQYLDKMNDLHEWIIRPCYMQKHSKSVCAMMPRLA